MDEGYGEMSAKMLELAAEQPGFLGVESARPSGGSRTTGSSLDPVSTPA